MTRDEVFDSLHVAHAAAWSSLYRMTSGPRAGALPKELFDWRMAWWAELEKGFPDKIKNGVRYDASR